MIILNQEWRGQGWQVYVLAAFLFVPGIQPGSALAQTGAVQTESAGTQGLEETSPNPFGDLEEEIEAAEAENGAADNDPLEGYNRFMSSVNGMLRGIIIDPAVDVYQAVVPEPVQNAISNAAANAMEPITAGSSLLQGDTENAANAAKRFLVNTTVGLGGISDQASDMGIESRKMDPGLAAGAQGVDPGAHIVLPVVGPSNMRDAPGDIAVGLIPGVGVAKAVDGAATYSENQDEIKSISEGALDPYTAEKQAYEQHRAHLVRQAQEELARQKAAEETARMAGENAPQ